MTNVSVFASPTGPGSHFCIRPRTRSRLGRWAPIPLRLIVGCGFIAHAAAKVGRGPERFAAVLHAIGVPAAHLMAWVTIATEFFGGLAVLLGAFVPLVTLPMSAFLLVAIFSVHWQYGFSSIRLVAVTPAGAQFGPVGYECSLLYLTSLAALVVGGSGPLSIEAFIHRKTSRRLSSKL